MLSEEMYGGIWEKSIEFPKKVYRHFSDRSVQTLSFLPTSALKVSYNRTTTSVKGCADVGARGRKEEAVSKLLAFLLYLCSR